MIDSWGDQSQRGQYREQTTSLHKMGFRKSFFLDIVFQLILLSAFLLPNALNNLLRLSFAVAHKNNSPL